MTPFVASGPPIPCLGLDSLGKLLKPLPSGISKLMMSTGKTKLIWLPVVQSHSQGKLMLALELHFAFHIEDHKSQSMGDPSEETPSSTSMMI